MGRLLLAAAQGANRSRAADIWQFRAAPGDQRGGRGAAPAGAAAAIGAMTTIAKASQPQTGENPWQRTGPQSPNCRRAWHRVSGSPFAFRKLLLFLEAVMDLVG